MKNLLKSLFILIIMMLPVINVNAQFTSVPPGGGPVYIWDRIDIIYYADGSSDVINVCTYGPGFCTIDGPMQ
jgi:hypothetical protein